MITVIVAMYNGEKYIRECIESILEQDYKDLEIFLVDDGSPDQCGKIAEEYAVYDERIYVIHQQNSGVSIARNIAINQARGEYLCVLDQDDVISKDYVSYLYGLCRKYNAKIALTPQVDKFFKCPREYNELDRIEVISGKEAAAMMLYHKIVISPWNKIFETSLIKENEIYFNPKFFNGEGFAFSIESYLKSDRVVVGNRKVYHYRVGDPKTGASKFKEEYILSSLGAQEYIRNKLPQDSKKLQMAWKFSNWHTHCDCLNIMIGCVAEIYYPDLYKRLRNEAQKNGLIAWNAPVSAEQKMRGLMFKMNPYIASKIINKFRVRKFTKYVPENEIGGGYRTLIINRRMAVAV